MIWLRRILSWTFGGPKDGPDSTPPMCGESHLDESVDANVNNMPQGQIEKLEDPLNEKPGLEVKWAVGERIPWKGIWFFVAKVEKAQLTLVPERMTFKMSKKLEAVR